MLAVRSVHVEDCKVCL